MLKVLNDEEKMRAITYLLSSSIPNVELDGSTVGVEQQRVHFYSQRSDIFLFEFSSQVTLDKGGLSDPSVSDKNELELWNVLLLCLHHGCFVVVVDEDDDD